MAILRWLVPSMTLQMELPGHKAVAPHTNHTYAPQCTFEPCSMIFPSRRTKNDLPVCRGSGKLEASVRPRPEHDPAITVMRKLHVCKVCGLELLLVPKHANSRSVDVGEENQHLNSPNVLSQRKRGFASYPKSR
ncbi:hypothetical protein Lesp02_09490 [Lentzea sp. NBRC 105346]|uniref:hypothetical protein n=1 Tax=Lentzea sp. NBRC 105346 TaxID=3032205 RepID=UPI0024A07D54|nr:hypothetical protein [Lentzea sp. NBRC 105346]GLZ28759.1 hypothetical protein Lesp02_09490 [Lentzea sp. NBRC 105346]